MRKVLLISTCFLLLCTATARAWDVRIKDASIERMDDSLRVEMWLDLSAIQVDASKACWVLPRLSTAEKSQTLPPLVVSGKRRYRFDYREQTFAPSPYPPVYQVLLGNKRRRGNEIHYAVTVPYLSWMSAARLTLTQIEKDCCHERMLTLDTLQTRTHLLWAERAEAPQPQEQEQKQPQKQEQKCQKEQPQKCKNEALRSESITLYIDYPVNETKILPRFSYNNLELAKLERLLWPLLNKGTITIRALRVCGYASPEGRYGENERLASGRTRGFVDYVLKTYPVSPAIIQATHVAEDWDGLVRLLEEKHPPYYTEAIGVIHSRGVLEGRERDLMNLRGGTVYTDMCASMFPLLRRIEITVEYELCVKEDLK